ncbi:histone deacetylase 6-like [Montipora capricornis]|uniref:histone deacetylase 6-like n=1 Tax=Montipora capricornis TaxID=246305 RepID=UPI0035F11B76
MASGGSEFMGFSVAPKLDCPHVQSLSETASLHIDVTKPCKTCVNIGENWLCLMCSEVMCSRYVKGHMVDHNAESGHMLVLSFSDLSVWCYDCDSYVSSPQLQMIVQAAELSKHGGN